MQDRALIQELVEVLEAFDAAYACEDETKYVEMINRANLLLASALSNARAFLAFPTDQEIRDLGDGQ